MNKGRARVRPKAREGEKEAPSSVETTNRGTALSQTAGGATGQGSFALNFLVTCSGELAGADPAWGGQALQHLREETRRQALQHLLEETRRNQKRGQDEGEQQRPAGGGGGGEGCRKTNSDKPRQEGEALRETAQRLIRTGMATRMIGRWGEKLREMSRDGEDSEREGGRGRGRRERERTEDVRRGVGAAENGMGPDFEHLPTSELAILLSIFHLSLRQAERAKRQVLLIIECSILI